MSQYFTGRTLLQGRTPAATILTATKRLTIDIYELSNDVMYPMTLSVKQIYGHHIYVYRLKLLGCRW